MQTITSWKTQHGPMRMHEAIAHASLPIVAKNGRSSPMEAQQEVEDSEQRPLS